MKEIMILFLSGGTGTPKLLQGVLTLISPEEFSVISNVGDDYEIYGLHVSPDLDVITYTIAGVVDEEKMWGIKGDTFNFIQCLERIGEDSWFKLGDKDLSFCFLRSYLLRKGLRLSEACKFICDILNVGVSVFPASDRSIQTRILTEKGWMHFQEWWVREKGFLKVLNIDFKGADIAKSVPGVLKAINCAEKIVIGPSNPVTSIGPILAVKEIREALEKTEAKVVAVSPIIGDSPLSGPAGTLMEFLNLEVSPLGVAKVYESFLDCLIIDKRDKSIAKRIEKELGIEVVSVNTIMKTLNDKKELAEKVLRV